MDVSPGTRPMILGELTFEQMVPMSTRVARRYSELFLSSCTKYCSIVLIEKICGCSGSTPVLVIGKITMPTVWLDLRTMVSILLIL